MAELASSEFLMNPDGMRFRDYHVYVIRYREGIGEINREEVARAFLPASRHAIMQVDDNIVRIFLSFKTQSGDYGMSGVVYEYERSTLRRIRGDPMFIGENWAGLRDLIIQT